MKKTGFWTGLESLENLDPSLHVDHSWNLGERIQVIKYLRAGYPTVVGTDFVICLMGCKSKLGMDNGELTDGKWTWPVHLIHYLECHSVKPPEDFLEHIRSNEYSIPFNQKYME